MAPEAKSEDLLYVTTGLGPTLVFTYPDGDLVGRLPVAYGGLECIDRSGDVFVPATHGVFEFTHASTAVKSFLPLRYPIACSVDPITGNLAVVAAYDTNVYIYQNAGGLPAKYPDSSLDYMSDVAYDSSGNLVVEGEYASVGHPFALLELAYGSGNFKNINISASSLGINSDDTMAWDGKYVDIASLKHVPHSKFRHDETIVNRFAISGNQASLVGQQPIDYERPHSYPQFWITGRTVIEPSDAGPKAEHIEYWAYPRGSMKKRFAAGDFFGLYGVAISPAR